MLFPEIDQESFLASPSPGDELCGGDPSDSPWRCPCSCPRSMLSQIEMDVLGTWSPPDSLNFFIRDRKNHHFGALTLTLHWVSQHGFLMRPSFPIPQCLRPKCLLSRFLRVQRTAKEYTWQDFLVELVESRRAFGRNRVIFDHRTRWNYWSIRKVHRTAVDKVFSHQTRGRECFADSSNIPWNPPTTFQPDQIAAILQKSLPWFCVLLSQQAHVFPICVMSTYNDSWIGLHKLCQIRGNWQSKWLSVSSSAPRTFVTSFLFHEKFLFCTGMVESIRVAISCTTTAYQWLFRDSHPSLRTLWSAVIRSPKFSARGAVSPVRLLQRALVILVLMQMSQFRSFEKWVKNTVLTR